MKSRKEIIAILNGAHGSEAYHRFSPFAIYPVTTDGVIALAEAAGCITGCSGMDILRIGLILIFWLIEIYSSGTKPASFTTQTQICFPAITLRQEFPAMS